MVRERQREKIEASKNTNHSVPLSPNDLDPMSDKAPVVAAPLLPSLNVSWQ